MMKTCILDGEQISNRKELHEILAGTLDFPEWYGKNLDALYDCLTEEQEEVQIEIRHMEELERRLGSYTVGLRKVLTEASRENPRISWK
jgi:ribonuclease inhibitor